MNKNGSKDGSCHVEPDIQRYHVEPHIHSIAEQPDRQDSDAHTADEWVEYLPSGIELQVLLVSCSYAGDADNHKGCYLTPYKIAVKVDEPPLDSIMNIAYDATPIIKQFRVNGVLEKLHQE